MMQDAFTNQESGADRRTGENSVFPHTRWSLVVSAAAGAEVDLFWQDGRGNYAVEVKYSQAPRLTPSMKSALQDLKLEHLWVVYPGSRAYPLAERITAIPLKHAGVQGLPLISLIQSEQIATPQEGSCPKGGYGLRLRATRTEDGADSHFQCRLARSWPYLDADSDFDLDKAKPTRRTPVKLKRPTRIVAM